MSRYKGNNTVQLDRAVRSMFDLTHNRRMSLQMGELTPVNVEELLPGDSVRASTEFLMRLMPTLAPIYDSIQVKVFHHFVPIRLIWKEAKEFFTGGVQGHGVGEEPIPPYIKLHTLLGTGSPPTNKTVNGTLADFLKMPNFIDQGSVMAWTTADVDINVLPFLAYQKVWIDWYMNANFQNEEDLDFSLPALSGLQANSSIFSTRQIEYTKDRFTSAMLEPQRGQEVLMPLAGTGFANYLENSNIVSEDESYQSAMYVRDVGSFATLTGLSTTGEAAQQARVENIDNVELDTSSVSLNDFRAAWMLQKWYERANVGGHRYEDMMWAMFQVKPQDFRTQRSEFVTGGIVPVKISEIVSTAYSTNDEDAVIPVGNLSGHGITYGKDNQARYYAHEHGYFITLMVIVPRATYFQGLPKMFTRKSWMDWPWPQFGNLGEQPVFDHELYADPASLTQDEVGEFSVFGYQSVYADWKQREDHSSGVFRDELLYWTLARPFADAPVLGTTFTEVAQSASNQIFTVQDAPNFLVYLTNIFTKKTALPYYGKPF